MNTTEPVTCVAEFMRQLKELPSVLYPDEPLWYRGHAEVGWRLNPSLLRKPYVGWAGYRKGVPALERDWLGQQDLHYFKAFKRLAAPQLKGMSDFEIYSLMQHHGLPTRLLDWSESSLVALHFAVKDRANRSESPEGAADAEVIILNPSEIYASEGRGLPFEEEKAFPPEGAVGLLPPNSNPRLRAQRGRFTLHGLELDVFEKQEAALDERDQIAVLNRRIVGRLRIKGKAKTAIYAELTRLGISDSVLFPDLDGMAREILHEHKLPAAHHHDHPIVDDETGGVSGQKRD